MHRCDCGMMECRGARTDADEHGKDVGVDQLVGLIFIALPLLLIFMVFQRQRRQQRELVTAQAGIVPGARVMTTSGLYGTVVSVEENDDDTVLLEVAPGVRTTWARLAIARIVTDPAPARPEPEPEPGAPPAAT
jgi:preprotein translocase subunit YajC